MAAKSVLAIFVGASAAILLFGGSGIAQTPTPTVSTTKTRTLLITSDTECEVSIHGDRLSFGSGNVQKGTVVGVVKPGVPLQVTIARGDQAVGCGTGNMFTRVWVNLKAGEQKTVSLAVAARAPSGGPTLQVDAVTTMEFVKIAPGTFQMGSDVMGKSERPAHQVTLTKGFELGKYEVTQVEYEAVIGDNPTPKYFRECPSCPVVVSWKEAQQFIEKLNARLDGYTYRLPTEAEWEYAARAGTTEDFSPKKYKYSRKVLDDIAWHEDNTDPRIYPGGQKRPNAWGLYDMFGNVAEWVQDRFGNFPAGPATDPTGPSSGTRWVYRGCSTLPSLCWPMERRSWYGGGPFHEKPNDIGFRLLRVPASTPTQ